MNSLWFILGCCFVMLEIGHPGLLYFLAFAGGALVAFAVSWLGYAVETQNIVFFVASVVSIAMIYLFVKKTDNDTKSHRSNVDQLIGRVVKVTQVQSVKIGVGKVGGEVWSIKVQGDGQLEVGMKVIVVGVQGCHLQVTTTKVLSC